MLTRLYGLIAAALLLVGQTGPAAADSGYKIQPGDVLQLEVLQDSSLNRSLLVLPDGSVSVPMIGSLKASGQSVDALRAQVSQSLASSFSSKPTVYLSVTSLAQQNPATLATAGRFPVYVLGEVAKSGEVDVKPGTTLIQALAMSGGFTSYAATRRVELLRQDASGQQQAYHFDYQALISGAASPALVLRSGDVIVVPQRRLFE